MSEPQYKLVNGELVELTQAEIDALAADQQQGKVRASLDPANKNLDMGKTMFEVLND